MVSVPLPKGKEKVGIRFPSFLMLSQLFKKSPVSHVDRYQDAYEEKTKKTEREDKKKLFKIIIPFKLLAKVL